MYRADNDIHNVSVQNFNPLNKKNEIFNKYLIGT